MRIIRRGTDNNWQGEYEVNLENTTVDWDGRKALRIHAHRARDFAWKRDAQTTEQPASKSKHDYRVEISVSEFTAQLHELAEAASGPSARLIATSLRPSLRDLLTLALLCVRPRKTKTAAPDRPTR